MIILICQLSSSMLILAMVKWLVSRSAHPICVATSSSSSSCVFVSALHWGGSFIVDSLVFLVFIFIPTGGAQTSFGLSFFFYLLAFQVHANKEV